MNDFALSLLLLGALSTGTQLPFWAGANQFGLMPEGSGGLVLLRAGTEYDATKEFQWKWGVSLAGQYDSRNVPEKTADFSAMVDELYASARWKALRLDAGMKHVDIDFLGAGMPSLGSMSTTGGHIVWSGNARTMPGYLITLDPVAVPFTHQVLWVHGAFGDYKMLDKRTVSGPLVHRTKIFVLLKILPQFDFQLGLDHVALWGGTDPATGQPVMPVTLDNYFRVITGRHASSSGTLSDQLNTIGDHLGGFVCRFDWRGDGWKAAFQRDVPYEDGSGMLGIQNWPDGVYTFWFGSDNKDRWVSDILYEFQYTKKQSGTYECRPTTPEEQAHLDPKDQYHYYTHVYGGLDNYFNGAYSGWTHYGRTIGNPLFSPQGTHDATWTGRTLVSGIENNRIKAHHLSLSGRAFHRLPYKLMLTYSQNYGIYQAPYLGETQWLKPWGTVKETPLHQVSGAFVGEIPFASSPFLTPHSAFRHFTLTYGLYADRGQLLPDAFGATVGLRWDLRVR